MTKNPRQEQFETHLTRHKHTLDALLQLAKAGDRRALVRAKALLELHVPFLAESVVDRFELDQTLLDEG